MSNNLIPLEVAKSEYVETSLLKSGDYIYSIFKGSLETTYRRVTTTSYSLSSITFSAPPPNKDTIVSKKVFMTLKLRFTINGTIGAGNLFDGWGLTIAPRALPIANSLSNVTLQLNDGSFNIPISDVITCFERYGYDDYKKCLTAAPCFLDKTQSYSELINTVRNPLGSNFNSFNSKDEPRGGFNTVRIVTNTPTQAVIEVEVTEPLIISPLSTFENEPGFIGVQNIDLNCTLESNLLTKWFSKSTSDAGVWNNHTVEIIQQPYLEFTYYSPQETKSISDSYVYPFMRVERYVTDVSQNIAPGQQVEITSNSIQLSTIPRRMYVFCRKSNNTLTPTDTDTFLRLDNISLSFGNRSGLLSSATPRQLYEMSKENGCDLSYNEWYGSYNTGSSRTISGVGSVLCLSPGLNIGLDALSSPGTQSQLNIQLTAKFTNIHPTETYTRVSLYIVVLSEGVFSMLNSHVSTQVGIVTASESLNAPVMSVVESPAQYGGNFFSSLRNIISKVPGYVSKALPYVKGAYDIAKMAGLGYGQEGCESLNLEEQAQQRDGMPMGEGMRRRRRKGRGMVGGELVTRQALRDEMY